MAGAFWEVKSTIIFASSSPSIDWLNVHVIDHQTNKETSMIQILGQLSGPGSQDGGQTIFFWICVAS